MTKYEMRLEDKPSSNRNTYIAFVIVILVAVAVAIVSGFFIGKSVGENAAKSRSEATVIPNYLDSSEFEALRKRVNEGVSAQRLRDNLKYFTSVPHMAASNESYEQAVYTRNEWLKQGLDTAELKKYTILLSFPEKPGVVTLLDDSGAALYRTALKEEFLVPSENDSRVVPPFNAFSPPGNVTGKLVYANYGRAQDFALLKKNNISCKGKIAIMRYSKSFRGNKVIQAHKAGAVAAILYMDPENYAKEGVDKVFPQYNWMPSTGVQRGTIKYSPARGDVLTPGYPAIDGVYRIPMKEAKKQLPQIPSHPISYKDAEPLLRTLTGSLPDPSWKGGINISYGVQMADNDTRVVNVQVNTKLEMVDIYNVIGTITGSQEPDQLVILGNHRDAWVYGATDPSSGTAAMMEVSRVLGQQTKRGWRPKRSIVFCSWGAEEPQIMGAAEWVEEYAKILFSRAVAYFNVDMSVDGNFSFRAKSMPLMDWVLMDATKTVPSPREDGQSLFEEWRMKKPSGEVKNAPYPALQSIRAGSDYVVFYQRLGIPCVDIRYTYDSSKGGNPLYHTVHDNFYTMSKLIDPEFKFHKVTTQVWAQLTLSFTESAVIPFNVSHYGVMLDKYTKSLDKTKLAAHSVELKYLEAAVTNYSKVAKDFEDFVESADKTNPVELRKINTRLLLLERAFVSHDPLFPEKPLQRHVILTPTIHLYGSWYAGIREAVYRAELNPPQGTWEEVKQQVSVAMYAINSAAMVLKLTPL